MQQDGEICPFDHCATSGETPTSYPQVEKPLCCNGVEVKEKPKIHYSLNSLLTHKGKCSVRNMTWDKNNIFTSLPREDGYFLHRP